MAVVKSGVSSRARYSLAAVSIGAVAIVAFVVVTFGSRIGAASTGSQGSKVAAEVVPASSEAQSPEELRKQAMSKIAGLPLYFEANRGQVDPSVRYLARSGRYSLFLTDDAAVFSLIGGEFHKGPMPAGFPYKAGGDTNLTESAVRVRLVGANQHPQVEGLEPLPGRVNYLVGPEKKWHRDVPTFGRVRFYDVYPGVDLVYYGTPSSLEYDLIAAPGADTSKIKFAIEGPAKTIQTASGDLVIGTASGVIKIEKPQNYQQNADGSRTPVAGSFTLSKDATVVAGVPTRQVGFQLASYDRSRTLYIDPVLATIPYSTYFGGNASSIGPLQLEQFASLLGNATLIDSETGVDVALDPSSNAYITGTAYSNNLPAAGFFQSTLNGANSPPSQNPNVFVAKFNTSLSGGASLIYATYIGANGNTKAGAVGHGDGDLGFGIAVDGDGDAYVVGQTYSGQMGDVPRDVFPGTASCGVWGQTNIGSNGATNQGFVTELLAAGNALQYSCYIPGAHNATAARVALVPGCMTNCDAYIVGSTQSTAGAVMAAGPDGFVVTGDAAQSQLATGQGGLSNAFIMRVAGGGAAAAPIYSSYYGGTSNGSAGDVGLGISVVSATQVGITGAAFSNNIPLSMHPAQSGFLGGTSTSMAYLAEFNTTSGALTYGSYLGGSGNGDALVSVGDVGTAIVLDGSNAWVAGLTASTNFPVSATPFESTNEAETMAGPPATTGFITELTPSGTSGLSQITYSTYFGGTGFSIAIPILGDFGTGDAIGAMAESGGKVYVTGLTTSASALETGYVSTFPLSANKCQSANKSSGISIEGFNVPVTAFVSELNPSLAAASQLVFSTLLGGSGMADIGLGLAFNSGAGDIYVVGSTYSTDFPVTSNGYQLFNNDFNTANSEQSTAAFLTEVNPAGNTCPTPFVKPTPTATATGATATATPTATRTATATATATGSPGATPTATATATATKTATATATATATGTATTTPKASPSATATATASPTGSQTPTATATATKTATATATSTGSSTPTATATTTATATPTATATATTTATPTPTPTPLGTLSFKPTSVNFGDKTKIGKVGKKKVTIKNTSSKSSKISVMVTGETTSAPFAVTTQCIKTLAPGKSCKVSVTFTPPDSLPHDGSLIVNDDATGNPQSIPLTGTGAAPK